MAFLDRLLPVAVLVIVGLSGVRLALLLLDGLLLVVLRGGERLGEGDIDIGRSGELISALRFFLWCLLFCLLNFVMLARLAVGAGFLFGFFFHK